VKRRPLPAAPRSRASGLSNTLYPAIRSALKAPAGGALCAAGPRVGRRTITVMARPPGGSKRALPTIPSALLSEAPVAPSAEGLSRGGCMSS
jgi:hypothetical protein